MADRFCFGCYNFRPAEQFTKNKLQRAKCDCCIDKIKARTPKSAAKKKTDFEHASKLFTSGKMIIMGMDT